MVPQLCFQGPYSKLMYSSDLKELYRNHIPRDKHYKTGEEVFDRQPWQSQQQSQQQPLGTMNYLAWLKAREEKQQIGSNKQF